MKHEVQGSPSFSHIRIILNPGESITAESDAMASMDGRISQSLGMNGGGFFSAFIRNWLANESFFVNHFTNKSDQPAEIVLTQSTPGQINGHRLENGESIFFQPGAYIASTPGVKLSVKWAGIWSWFAREGLFRIQATAPAKGIVWYGAYGEIFEREIDGELLVDTSHLVGYEPGIKIDVQLAGGLFSSFFSGEGFVTRISGKGKVYFQNRSIGGLVSWLYPRV